MLFPILLGLLIANTASGFMPQWINTEPSVIQKEVIYWNTKSWTNVPEDVLIGNNTPVYTVEFSKTPKAGRHFSKIDNAWSGATRLLKNQQKRTSIILDNGYSVISLAKLISLLREPIGRSISMDVRNRTEHSDLEFVYPQIFVVIDYDTYKLHGKNLTKILAYVATFWNGVDLKFRPLNNPKVRINIAAIVIATDAHALSFMSKNRFSNDTINGDRSVDYFTKFLKSARNTVSPSEYDIAIAMQPYTMCEVKNELCVPDDHGFHVLRSGPCAGPNSGAVIQDNGGFHGMISAARQIAYLFGAIEETPARSICRGHVGLIMSRNPLKTLRWSRCNLQAFHYMFRETNNSNCIFNAPSVSSPLPRVLPGRLLTADEQCKKIQGTTSCGDISNICVNLQCKSKHESSSCPRSSYPAADGTTCGHGKICFDGNCVNQ